MEIRKSKRTKIRVKKTKHRSKSVSKIRVKRPTHPHTQDPELENYAYIPYFFKKRINAIRGKDVFDVHGNGDDEAQFRNLLTAAEHKDSRVKDMVQKLYRTEVTHRAKMGKLKEQKQRQQKQFDHFMGPIFKKECENYREDAFKEDISKTLITPNFT